MHADPLFQLATRLAQGHITLEEAITSGYVPEHILYHFSCNSAARVWIREQQAGRNPDPRFLEMLRVKRLWLEKHASDQDLQNAKSAFWSAFWDPQQPLQNEHIEADKAVTSSITRSHSKDAAIYAALDVVRYAVGNTNKYTKEAARIAERHWQRYHLAEMLLCYREGRLALLRILSAQQKQRAFMLMRWQQELEEGLY